MSRTTPLDAGELSEVLSIAETSFYDLRNARIFITGGTGFFGHWLLESILFANRELSLNVALTVLTRNASRFRSKSPHIAEDSSIVLCEGDLRTFTFPRERHTHVVHAATDSTVQPGAGAAVSLAEGIVDGTRRVLTFARETGATRFLYVSSGAVYGRAQQDLYTAETSEQAPNPLLLGSAYDEAKRMAEHFCISYASGTALQPVIARCFAFVGPHLPLDEHFAIGNFLSAALKKQPIIIKGDGTARRSWLYMSDLAAWLWTMLASAQPFRAYNVGSDEAFTIADSARLVASMSRSSAANTTDSLPVVIEGKPKPDAPSNNYVPCITRARTELGLTVTVPLAAAIERTIAWHKLRQAV